MMILSRFSAGRIVLHVIAMVSDRAVAFHAAGIARELPWFGNSDGRL